MVSERSRLRFEPGASEAIIRSGLRSGTAAVLAILSGAVAVGLLFAVFNPRPETIPPLAPGLLLAAASALGLWALVELLGRERLISTADRLVYERCVAAFCWRRRSLPRSQRVDLRAFVSGSERGVIVAAGTERWHIGRGLKPDEIRKLHAWLAAQWAAVEEA